MKFIKKVLKNDLSLKVEEFNQNINEILKDLSYLDGEYNEEVFKSVKRAWDFIFSNKDKITVNIIIRTHFLLYEEIDYNIAGKIRASDILINNKTKSYFSKDIIESDLMERVCNKFKEKRWSKKRKAKEVYDNFLDIYPFERGNYKIARVLYNICLL